MSVILVIRNAVESSTLPNAARSRARQLAARSAAPTWEPVKPVEATAAFVARSRPLTADDHTPGRPEGDFDVPHAADGHQLEDRPVQVDLDLGNRACHP